MTHYNCNDQLTQLVSALDNELLLSLLVKNLNDNFELLDLKYRTLVYKRVYQMVRNREDAEDIVQETFLKAHQDMSQHPEKIHVIKSPKAWLFTISKNIVINRKRKEKKDLAIDSIEGLVIDPDDYDESKQPESAALATEKKQTIIECAKKLPNEYRGLVIAYLFHEVKYSELAKMAGKSVADTKSMLAEGIDLLRKMIKNVDDEYATLQCMQMKLAS